MREQERPQKKERMMSKELVVSTRTETGKGAVGRARKNGMVPAVLYGKGDRTTECVVDGVDEKGRLLLSMDGKTVAVEDGEVTWKK